MTPSWPDTTFVSVIVPTLNRAGYMPRLYHAFATQTHPHRELLVYDDSPTADGFLQEMARLDPRVRYFHSHQRQSIGQKRNALVDKARGEVIVHFDDDDYYAPAYIAVMLAHLGSCDIVKLSAWYNCSPGQKIFAYWDCQDATLPAYSLSPSHTLKAATHTVQESITWGFGFSYVYRRQVWQKTKFSDQSFGEDFDFVQRAFAAGCRGKLVADAEGIVLHMVHTGNASRVLPQYILPPFLMARLFGAGLRDYSAATAASYRRA